MMAGEKKKVLKNIPIYFNDRNISGASNNLTLNGDIEQPDSTNFGSSAKDAEAGLEKVSGTAAIMFPEDFDLEGVLFAARGAPALLSFFVDGLVVGTSIAFSAYGLSLKHYPGGQVGALIGSTIEMSGRGVPLLRGVLLENEATTYTEASLVGEDIEIAGGVPDGYALYLALHVLELTGITNLAVVLQRDADNSFASPLTAMTLQAFTASGFGRDASGNLPSVAGPLTDDNFRLAFTPTGTGSFKLAAQLALVPTN